MLLAGSTILSQGVVMLFSPILTRLYTPADFGILGVYTSLFSIAAVVVSLRYELALPLPEDDEAAINLLALSLLIVPLISLLSGFAVFALGDKIVLWTNTPALKPYLWLIPVGLLGVGVYTGLRYWAIRKKSYKQIAQTQLGQSLWKVLTQLTLGLLNFGPAGLLLGNIVGHVSGIRSLAAFAYRQDKEILSRVNKYEMRSLAQRYRRFPLLSSGSALLNRAGLDLPILLLAALYGPQVVGWFSFGRQVIKLPMSLVGRSTAQVFIGEASQLAQESHSALYGLFSKTVKRLMLVGGLPIALLGLISPWLFSLVFGDIWHEAGVYVQILTGMFVAEFVAVPVSSTLTVLERQDIQLFWDVGRLVLVIGVFWLANSLVWTPVQALGAYSASMFVAYVCLLGLIRHILSE